MSVTAPTALIAEDEPLLAMSLAAELKKAWPELALLAPVGHGEAAVQKALALRPDVMFLDIRMPGMTGLEAAQALGEDWPDGEPLPLIVFVTAYEQYAVQAFERSAADYLLKPVQSDRLKATCQRLQAALKARDGALTGGPGTASAEGSGSGSTSSSAAVPLRDDAMLEQLRALLGGVAGASLLSGGGGAGAAGVGSADPSLTRAPALPRLTVIQASVGTSIHMVPVADIVYFEAADKYIRVLTSDREYLIRTSLKELLPQLDPDRFWQIHRGTLVRDDAIATAVRDESGKVTLSLRSRPERLTVSRLYAPRFKAM